jgi:hypothetical protein
MDNTNMDNDVEIYKEFWQHCLQFFGVAKHIKYGLVVFPKEEIKREWLYFYIISDNRKTRTDPSRYFNLFSFNISDLEIHSAIEIWLKSGLEKFQDEISFKEFRQSIQLEEARKVARRRITPLTSNFIKEFVFNQRKVPFLLHFTKIKNIPSILSFGLVPRILIDEKKVIGEINDFQRIDGHRDAICLSISFPNYKMLYKYSHGSDFAVLRITPSVLWEKNCAFYYTNASAFPLFKESASSFMTIGALEKMFAESPSSDSVCREEQTLFDYDPTDPQAEVLVFENIETIYLQDIVVKNKQSHDRLCYELQESSFGIRNALDIAIDECLFRQRDQREREKW